MDHGDAGQTQRPAREQGKRGVQAQPGQAGGGIEEHHWHLARPGLLLRGHLARQRSEALPVLIIRDTQPEGPGIPVEVSVNMPGAGAATGLYAQTTAILSDEEKGLYISPLGEGWTTDVIEGVSVKDYSIKATVTAPSVIAPFVVATEGEGEGEEGEAEGEGETGEGEGETPPPNCFNPGQLTKAAEADLAPIAFAVACLMAGRAIRGRRD
jgi:hypothetical protein